MLKVPRKIYGLGIPDQMANTSFNIFKVFANYGKKGLIHHPTSQGITTIMKKLTCDSVINFPTFCRILLSFDNMLTQKTVSAVKNSTENWFVH